MRMASGRARVTPLSSGQACPCLHPHCKRHIPVRAGSQASRLDHCSIP